MTPRRRRSGGGSSDSGGSSGGQSPEPRRQTGPAGGGADVDPDHIDTMAGRLDATETRVGDIGGRIEQVDVGPSSMGVVGGNFTQAARSHLRNAKNLFRRVRDRIGQAREGTKATAQHYRDTETANVQRLNAIETDTDVPRTRTDTTTTPSSVTTPSGTTHTPPATHTPGSTTPSHAETPPASISDRLGGGGGDDGPPPDRTRPTGEDEPPRPDRNPPPPQAGVQSLGRFPEEILDRDANGRITHIDGMKVEDKLHEVAQQRAKVYLQEKRDQNPALMGGRTGNCVGHVIDTRTGEIFESTNGPDNDVIPPSRVHPEIEQRVDAMREAGPYNKFDRDGNPIPNTSHPTPWTDEPLRHAEVKGANEALRANPDARLSDLIAESNFTRGSGLKDAPFCANCSGILPDVPSNHGRREYDPETNRVVDRPH